MNKADTLASRQLQFGPDDAAHSFEQWRESVAFLYDAVEPLDRSFFLHGRLTQFPELI